MDLEMPGDERPTTLKKLIKRYFNHLEEPFRQAKVCSGCQKTLKIASRQLTHFPQYINVLLNREERVASVRALSNRIVEIPLTSSTKILGQRYEVTTVVARQTLLKGLHDISDSVTQPIVHYYTYSKN